jgi:transposase
MARAMTILEQRSLGEQVEVTLAVQMRRAGYKLDMIAAELQVSRRTVINRLRAWKKENEE